MAFIRMRNGLTNYEWDWPYIKGLTVYESLAPNDVTAYNRFYFNSDTNEIASGDDDETVKNSQTVHNVEDGTCVFGCSHYDVTETPKTAETLRFLSG